MGHDNHMKAWKISRYYMSLTIYHTNKIGRILMITKHIPKKGLDSEGRRAVIQQTLKDEGIDIVLIET